MNFTINSICFSWYGTNIQFRTRILLDNTSSLLFQTENRIRLLTWAYPQAFLDAFWSNIIKMIHSDIIAKASNFPFKKQTSFFIHYELSSHKDGWFNMETIWAGSLYMPKMPNCCQALLARAVWNNQLLLAFLWVWVPVVAPRCHYFYFYM